MLRVLNTITFAYDPREDRILAVVNIGRAEAWSCWLTRRLTLALLERTPEFVANASPVVQRAAPDVRKEVAAFEQEAAIVKTAPAMSRAEPQALRLNVGAAELLQRINLNVQGERVRLELHGPGDDNGAHAMVSQAEFQRILQMLRIEMTKAGWLPPAAPSPSKPPGDEATPKPARH